MPSMESITADAPLYTMFKGEPGTRKSTQALTYPGPQYWFSYDQKMRALQLPMKKFGIDPKTIQFDDYTSWDAARTKLEQFQVNCPFKTVVVDSITSLSDYMLRSIRKAKTGQTRQSGQAAGRSIGGIEVGELEDFNAESSGLMELLALTKDIHKFHKVHIILIAHIVRTESKDPKGYVNVSRQIVTAGKKVAAKLPAYCDEIYHFGVESEMDISKGGNYCLFTSHVGDDFARTSLPLPTKIVFGERNLFDEFIKPSMTKLKEESAVTKF